MDAVIRAFIIYVFLLAVFRLAGKRSLAQIDTFDFVLLLIIGEATQQALIGDDFSVTTALIVIVTLVSLEIVLAFLKSKSERLRKILDSVPVVLIENGRLYGDRTRKAGTDEDDILAAAREAHGLERLDQIKHAVMENGGQISVVPKRG